MATCPSLELGKRYTLQRKYDYYGASGIYALYCKNLVYVGESSYLASRWAGHSSGLINGTHPYPELQQAFNAGSPASFEVLEFTSRFVALRRAKEKEAIHRLKADGRYKVINRATGLFDSTRETITAPILDALEKEPANRETIEARAGLTKGYITALLNNYGDIYFTHKFYDLLETLGLELVIREKTVEQSAFFKDAA